MIACLYACEAARKSTVPPAIRRLANTFAACKEGMVKSVGEMFNTKPHEAWKFKHPPFKCCDISKFNAFYYYQKATKMQFKRNALCIPSLLSCFEQVGRFFKKNVRFAIKLLRCSFPIILFSLKNSSKRV